jgi:hypothetical protein
MSNELKDWLADRREFRDYLYHRYEQEVDEPETYTFEEFLVDLLAEYEGTMRS